ncbi:hypothetical protein FB45DRAFT_1037548 [Roridomyces roridus]|uniref:Uncharacterized protein n=1 Tax=Roridomyces roridus TaxID=1738132 RepID=A0AAD7B5D7_9AGAR|nr:hypothetical protein FB45DRAFT_1037548 [Roridomyces roridus]
MSATDKIVLVLGANKGSVIPIGPTFHAIQRLHYISIFGLQIAEQVASLKDHQVLLGSRENLSASPTSSLSPSTYLSSDEFIASAAETVESKFGEQRWLPRHPHAPFSATHMYI